MKRVISIILVAVMAAAFVIPAFAENEPAVSVTAGEVKEIASFEDLLAITADRTGNYKLVNDIDCKGETWVPVDYFSGTLDGNGFAIMNLHITEAGTSVRNTIDGNWKNYDTYFSGLFCVAENAVIKNLSLLGTDINVRLDDNVYVGGIAGYIADTKMENCTVNGTLQLTSSCKSFGLGGIAGYGWGQIDACTADVTLIQIDTDKEWKDEQFMGGIYANGYPDVTNCTVNIQGFDSDHGYVHDGGIGGMYILPHGVKYAGHVDNNKVTGFIHFFEDNKNRRAYCVGDIGEIMNWTLTKNGNDIKAFERRETKDYSRDLYPCMCENPQYDAVVTAPSENAYGFTTRTCSTCGYSYTNDYTSLNVYVEPEPEPEVSEPAETAKSGEIAEKHLTIVPGMIILGVAVILLIGTVVTLRLVNRSRHRKYQTRRTR